MNTGFRWVICISLLGIGFLQSSCFKADPPLWHPRELSAGSLDLQVEERDSVFFQKANEAWETRRWVECLGWLEQIRAGAKPDPGIDLYVAICYLGLDQPQRCLDLLNAESSAHSYWRSLALLRLGKNEEALDQLHLALEGEEQKEEIQMLLVRIRESN